LTIITCVSEVGERFGASYVVDVLAGSKSARIRENGHDALPSYYPLPLIFIIIIIFYSLQYNLHGEK